MPERKKIVQCGDCGWYSTLIWHYDIDKSTKTKKVLICPACKGYNILTGSKIPDD